MNAAKVLRGLTKVFCALLLTALVACGDAERLTVSKWRAVYDTIGDTVVVRTVDGSLWGDTAELVAELTIGELEGADEYMFGEVGSLAVAADGFLYVFDEQAKALRKYSPEGTHIATFGREGGGPGEYKRPDAGLAVLPDGRILLRDPGNARINVYSSDGESLDSWRIRGTWSTSRRLYVDTASNTYVAIVVNEEAGFGNWRWGLVRYGPDGSPGDTMPEPSWDYEPPQLEASHEEEGSSRFSARPVPFSPFGVWAFSPLGYYVGGLSTRYAIDLYRSDGVFRIERVYESVRVKPEERAEQERRVTVLMRRVDPSWRWNGPPIPDAKPPYKGFFIGQDGRIWVWLSQEAQREEIEEEAESERPGALPELRWREPVAFDVFEPDGRYLGRVQAPERFSIYPTPVARGDTVWAVVLDRFEVPYVVRFHVEHGATDATNT